MYHARSEGCPVTGRSAQDPRRRGATAQMKGTVDVDSSDTTVQELGATAVREGDLAVMGEDLGADLRRMSGRRLLITGGAGFLGYYLVQVPLAWNDAHPDEPPIGVTVLDNYFRDAPAWLKELERRPEVDLVVHDVRGPLPDQMGDFAYIIHAAGIASPSYYRAHPIETMDANINGLRTLLDYARQRLAAGLEMKGFLFYSSS